MIVKILYIYIYGFLINNMITLVLTAVSLEALLHPNFTHPRDYRHGNLFEIYVIKLQPGKQTWHLKMGAQFHRRFQESIIVFRGVNFQFRDTLLGMGMRCFFFPTISCFVFALLLLLCWEKEELKMESNNSLFGDHQVLRQLRATIW